VPSEQTLQSSPQLDKLIPDHPERGRPTAESMDPPELTLSSHPWPLPWGSPRGRMVGLRPLADEGESRRPLGDSNPPETASDVGGSLDYGVASLHLRSG
jgi:hypothetical protein